MKQFSRAIIMILSTLEKQNVLRGRTFDFLGGVWVISEKKYPADWFRGEKVLARKYLAIKNSYTEKIYLSWSIMLEKKSYTVVCQEKNSISSGFEKKNSYPNQITHTPPQKVKWSAPK